MIKSANKNRVIIEPFPFEEEGLIKNTQIAREAEIKKQNRGTVVLLGKDCDEWIKPGDTVSFYRNAATTLTEDGKEYVVVHEDHILVSF